MSDTDDTLDDLPPQRRPRKRQPSVVLTAAEAAEALACSDRVKRLGMVAQRMREAARVIEDRALLDAFSSASERAASLERSRLAVEALHRVGVLNRFNLVGEDFSRLDSGLVASVAPREVRRRMEGFVRTGVDQLFADPSGTDSQLRLIAMHKQVTDRMVSRVAAVIVDVCLADEAWHASLRCLNEAREGVSWTAADAEASMVSLASREQGRLIAQDPVSAAVQAAAALTAARAFVARVKNAGLRLKQKTSKEAKAARRARRRQKSGPEPDGPDLLNGMGTG